MNAPTSIQASAGTTTQPYVSYSINYEDVVLRRLFRGCTTGFFVDVGAEHPSLGNDFQGFYEAGWTGINIEPNPSYFALLQEHRPRDRTLQLALSDMAGQDLVFFEVENTGLSTCDEEQANACENLGYVVKRHDIRTSTLKDVLDAAQVPHIDVLKVDVEGFEERVLLGNDWKRYRPSVIMVEATYPQTCIRRPTNVRSNLEALGYRHFYFDNLNDFFADVEFTLPDDAALPPNVFDDFVRSELVAVRKENKSLRENFATAETYARSLETERSSLAAQRDAVSTACSTLKSDCAVLQQHNRELNDAAGQFVAITATIKRISIAAILGRTTQLRGLLASGSEVGLQQGGRWPMPEQSKTLVMTEGQGATDQSRSPSSLGLLPSSIQAELLMAQLQASDEQNRRLLNDIDDLRHENGRLLASINQTHGESQSLRRALAPSYTMHDELASLREQMSGRDVAMIAQMRVMVHEENVSALNGHHERTEKQLRVVADNENAMMLCAIYTSSSWKLTAPLRAFARLFKSRKPR